MHLRGPQSQAVDLGVVAGQCPGFASYALHPVEVPIVGPVLQLSQSAAQCVSQPVRRRRLSQRSVSQPVSQSVSQRLCVDVAKHLHRSSSDTFSSTSSAAHRVMFPQLGQLVFGHAWALYSSRAQGYLHGGAFKARRIDRLERASFVREALLLPARLMHLAPLSRHPLAVTRGPGRHAQRQRGRLFDRRREAEAPRPRDASITRLSSEYSCTVLMGSVKTTFL